jgi:hypothetical protein
MREGRVVENIGVDSGRDGEKDSDSIFLFRELE